jgi:hypothetical protein
MRSNEHPWHNARKAIGHRLFLGATVAASLTLVAFEWREPGPPTPAKAELPDDDLPMEMVPVVILDTRTAPAPKARQRTVPLIAPRPTAPVVSPSTEPDPGPSPEPGPAPAPSPDPSSLFPDEVVPVTPVFWGMVGVKPYFMDCLHEDPDRLEPCTEARIEAHLQRHFRIPSSVKGRLRTTVTFRIDADGRIGTIHCAPQVDAEVQQEVERVIRAMPTFVPGSQGGIPVPVYYQIPLSLRVG